MLSKAKSASGGKLTKIEKEEMLRDGKSKKRQEDFRKLKYFPKNISFEKYISLLEQWQSIYKIKPKKRFIEYKNVKI